MQNKINVREQFKGKKITLLGLGILGRGVGDAAFLASCGAELIVVDQKSAAELAPSLEKLKQYPGIVFHFGDEQSIEDFKNRDLVIKAAGVAQDSPFILAAKAAGVHVAMSTALFAQYAREIGAKIVGVTGTRGKSTVTQMIFHTLERAGKRAHLGGNVRGRSTLAMLPDVLPEDFAVLELDSWQLQGFGDLQISPDIAVFTNLMPDHMNYYRGDMEAYFSDKANIFRNQGATDTLVVGQDIAEKVLAAKPQAKVLQAEIPDEWQLKVIGAHNRENAGLAAQALRALGLTEDHIRAGLESYEAMPGRLQFVSEKAGITIYNDNNATTPEATIAALRALDGKNIVLICGGSEKNLALEELVGEIGKRVKSVVLLPGKGTERLEPMLEKVPHQIAANMSDAVMRALTQSIDLVPAVILLSPGFASFGLFKNEYDRNDQFLEAIDSL